MGANSKQKGVKDFSDRDWRRRPRKDYRGKRVARLSLRVTPSEKDAIVAQAENHGQSLADYIVCRALYRRRRVRPEHDLS